MLKPSTRSAGMAVRVNQSFHSRGSVRSVRPASARRPSIPTGDSLNRKLFTAPVTSPFSTRYTPSRVRPVSSRVCGSTSRMYHRQVRSSPRDVPAIISGRDAAAPAAEHIRLPMAGVTGTPASPAEYRDDGSAASVPSLIHSVRRSGSPLSNTDRSSPDAPAVTNGSHSRPAAAGSLYRVTGSWQNRSPTLVPPPARLNTVRPSAVSLAPADQYRKMSRSATALGGSSVSYRPAGSATVRLAQPSRSASTASSAATSTSVKSLVAAPVHADRARSGDLAFS